MQMEMLFFMRQRLAKLKDVRVMKGFCKYIYKSQLNTRVYNLDYRWAGGS